MINSVSVGELNGQYEELNPVYEDWVSLAGEINSQSPSGMNGATISGGNDFAWLET